MRMLRRLVDTIVAYRPIETRTQPNPMQETADPPAISTYRLVRRCAGSNGCGTVFKLSGSGSNWIFSPLYAFTGGDDGGLPAARVIRDPNGIFYRTTVERRAGGTGVVSIYIPRRARWAEFSAYGPKPFCIASEIFPMATIPKAIFSSTPPATLMEPRRVAGWRISA
jgi:hypothetical protein